MSKTKTIPDLSTHPINPDSDSARIDPDHFLIKPFDLIFFFASVLILSTSLQNGRNELLRVEPEYGYSDLTNGLRSVLSDTGIHNSVILDGENIAFCRQAQRFYIQHDYKPAWTTGNQLNGNGKEMISLIEHTRDFGLEPDHYRLEALRDMQLQFSDKKNHAGREQIREKLEILLTDAALKLMVNLHAGYRAFDSTLFAEAWIEDLPGKLTEGIKHGTITENILSVQPDFVEYTLLQQATGNFVRQTKLTDDGPEMADPEGEPARFRDQVKQVLVRLGYLDRNGYDFEISDALKEFQLHHGLEPDGKTGKNTLEALKMTSLYHYRMLALNLDRLRKQDNSGDPMLYVNIPAYHLKIYKENKLQDTYRVIVGNPKTPTPQLSSYVERIIANPFWDVPQSITKKELLPKIKSDTGYLKRNRFKLVDKNNRTIRFESIDPEEISGADPGFRLRQDASSDNALGTVKFIFPNPYAVYLHDTPGKSLFSKDIRALSHGCIRVQNPGKLADYLAGGDEPDLKNISGIIAKGIHREFSLAYAVPIHISYITCEADDKGDLFFYKDIYGTDQKEMADLASFMGIE
jgi:L,D-transpeptidase YcbB